MNRQLVQAWLLRLAGAFEIVAFVAVVMPRSWMEFAHGGMGMGALPDAPVMMFLIRQASYNYGVHGLSLWLIATDVERFRPLVVFNGVGFLIGGFVFFFIDLNAGMPLWWTIADPLSCALFGSALLWLTRGRKDKN